MTAAVLLLLGVQDPIEERIEEILRRYEQRAAEEQAVAGLARQLGLLGGAATEPLARRLAEDLRDGAVSEIAEAILEALEGRPEAQGPLQAAFADGATPPAGRIELARALQSLLDPVSWREGLWAIVLDPGTDPEERLRAATLLLGAGDEGVAGLLNEMLAEESLAAGPPPEGSRRLEWSDEPRAGLVEERPGGGQPAPEEGREARRNQGERSSALAWGGAAVGIALFWILWRKGRAT